MTSSLFQSFETDGQAEVDGATLRYDDQWFKVRRPGGKNKRFKTLLQQRLRHLMPRPGQSMSSAAEEQASKITISTFIETCLISWGSEKYGDGKLVNKDGTPLAYSAANALELFERLPSLAADIMNTSQNDSLWLVQVNAEEDAGNSQPLSAGG